MDISIIIPTRNQAANLPRLLRSILLSQTLPLEVIIVDNHSTDGTQQIVQEIWKSFKSKEPVKKRGDKFSQPPTLKTKGGRGTNLRESQGQSANRRTGEPDNEQEPAKTKPSASEQIFVTRPPCPLHILIRGPERSVQKNWGAKHARSSHLLFLDADMELPPTLLPRLERLARHGSQAVVIPERSVGHDFWGKAVALERTLYQDSSLLAAPRFLARKTFLTIGGYDPHLIAGEDWDLADRLWRANIPVTRITSSLIHHEAVGFLPNLSRKWYYARHISRYAEKQPDRFAQQAKLSTRLELFWSERRRLVKQPLLTLAFLLIKGVIYIRWRMVR